MAEPFSDTEAPWWARPWMAAWPQATGGLSQPILPGWSFGAVTINEQNSSAPDTERQIVSAESYGRQIGKLIDAVEVLIARQDDAATAPAFTDLTDLASRIDAIKHEAAQRRIDQLAGDLALLKAADLKAFKTTVAQLRTVLASAD